MSRNKIKICKGIQLLSFVIIIMIALYWASHIHWTFSVIGGATVIGLVSGIIVEETKNKT